MLLFHPEDLAMFRKVKTWALTYKFKVAKDWWSINDL
jgi:hypothetical protein